MEENLQHNLLDRLLKSLEDDFDATFREAIFQDLKNSNPTIDALLGARLLLEQNNWDYKVMQQAFATTENRIKTLVQSKNKTRQWLQYAAVVVPLLLLSGYFLYSSTKNIDAFYTPADGLPQLMGTEKVTTWNDLMEPFQAKEYSKAYEIATQLLKQKPANDTALYYHAVVAYEVQEYAMSKANFDAVVSQKNSNFYNEAAYRLGFTLAKLQQTDEAKAQFKKVSQDKNNPYSEDATVLLKACF